MQTTIVIPPRLGALLDKCPLGPAVRLSIQDFEKWIGDPTKGLFFFPEYSDHGPKHISAVLAGAEALIQGEAWPHLTSEDAVVLTIATLLHDSAMHLTADGFLHLIDPNHGIEREVIRLLDEQTWSNLFEQFYLEARRWDEQTLHAILGDQNRNIEEEEDLAIYIRHPKDQPDPETWSLRYRKFLGEFVRRHHARLSHEIARLGVPGEKPLTLTRIPQEFADLAGIVARSHNMHLRSTFPYLKEKYYGRVLCRNSHPVFLMALLRIADYLEIRSDRVNPTLKDLQRLRSPISQGEWDAHLAVHEVRPDDEDREAIFVITKPPTAQTFLKLQSLLQGLQSELDTSWAVLGEVFSRQEPFSKLGLTLRRVRSNLDDLAQFVRSENPSYVPIRAAFDSAGASLLKLLVKPLYGDRPEIGVRELLQNALDAVHELQQWAEDQGDPHMKTIPLPSQKKDILITIDEEADNGFWLTISDRGIGMTAETIKNYFLTAGASHRNSDTWRKHFEENARSKVLRSGRFGIGALAAFLLGDRIEVFTRHVTSAGEDAIYFSAALSDRIIELCRRKKISVGTIIRIRLAPASVHDLSRLESLPVDLIDRPREFHWNPSQLFEASRERTWDWYSLRKPSVERRILNKALPQRRHTPSPRSKNNEKQWAEMPHKDYEAIYWSHTKGAPLLICNGILIGSRGHSYSPNEWEKHFGFPFKTPEVCVFDKNGKLPLNLQRDRLETDSLPFSRELFEEMVYDFCAYLLIRSPKPAQLELFHSPPQIYSNFFERHGCQFNMFWRSQSGTSFLNPWFLRKAGIKRVLVRSEASSISESDLADDYLHAETDAMVSASTDYWEREPREEEEEEEYLEEYLSSLFRPSILPTCGGRLLIPTHYLKYFDYPYQKNLRILNLSNDWHIAEWGDTGDKESLLLESIFQKGEMPRPPSLVAEWHIGATHAEHEPSHFSKLMDKISIPPIIPSDDNDRRKIMRDCHDRIKYHIKRWEFLSQLPHQ